MLTRLKTPLKKPSSASSNSKTVQSESDLQRKNYAQSTNTGFDFAETPLFPVQPKLKVNKPGDKYEQEADKMAEKVMQMPDKQIIQRKCAKCDEEEKEQNSNEGRKFCAFNNTFLPKSFKSFKNQEILYP